MQVYVALMNGEDDKADKIREQSISVGENLNEAEIDWLYDFSGDLAMLTNDEVFEHSPMTQQKLVQSLQNASRNRDGELMLQLLRKASFFPKEHLAYLRANAYDYLGYVDASLLFMQYAAIVSQWKDSYVCFVIEKLIRTGQLDDAKRLALDSLSRHHLTIELKVFSAAALLASSFNAEPQVAHDLSQKIIDTLSPMFNINKIEASVGKYVQVHGCILLSTAYSNIGDHAKSLETVNILISIDPVNADAYALRGGILVNTDRNLALADFEKAVKMGTIDVVPYLILAREEMMESKYRRGAYLCRQVLRHSKSDAAVATALEFLAICMFEQKEPLRKIKNVFEAALRITPNNERILENYRIVVEETLNQQKARVNHIDDDYLRNISPFSPITMRFATEGQSFTDISTEYALQSQLYSAAV